MMKVICTSTALTEERLAPIRGSQRWEMDKKGVLTIGKEYLVYGLEFLVDRDGYASGTNVVIVPDAGYLVSVRLDYFAMSDPRASRYWQARQWDAARTTLLPSSFYQEGYLDKCSAQNEYDADDMKDVLDDFERISALLASEMEEG